MNKLCFYKIISSLYNIYIFARYYGRKRNMKNGLDMEMNVKGRGVVVCVFNYQMRYLCKTLSKLLWLVNFFKFDVSSVKFVINYFFLLFNV